VAILALLLGGSAWLNVHQYVSGKVALATAPLKGEVAAKDKALEIGAGLIADTNERLLALNAALEAGTEKARAAAKSYRAAQAARPLPIQCAPGQARMDATNRALGAPVEK
jgi:hypothetical protein